MSTWIKEKDGGSIIIKDEHFTVCKIGYKDMYLTEKMQSDAQLILMAPEMLEELKFISQTLAAENDESWKPYIKQIDELVKKATKGQ